MGRFERREIMRLIFVLFASLKAQTCSESLITVGPNVVDVYGQIRFLLNSCGSSLPWIGLFADRLNDFNYLSLVDVVIPGHGYYRSATSIGAIATAMEISDFANDVTEQVALPLSVNILQTSHQQLYNEGSISTCFASDLMRSSVGISHYGQLYFDMLQGQDFYDEIEFGNKEFVNGFVSQMFSQVFLPFEQNFSKAMTRLWIPELSLYTTTLSLFTYCRSTWNTLVILVEYVVNLASYFTLDLVKRYLNEQNALWSLFVNVLRYGFDESPAVYYIHDLLSILHAVVRSTIRFLGKLIYNIDHYWNYLTSFETPFTDFVVGLFPPIEFAFIDNWTSASSDMQAFASQLVGLEEGEIFSVRDSAEFAKEKLTVAEEWLLISTTFTWIAVLPVRVFYEILDAWTVIVPPATTPVPVNTTSTVPTTVNTTVV